MLTILVFAATFALVWASAKMLLRTPEPPRPTLDELRERLRPDQIIEKDKLNF